jgi:hypothetical protein
MALQSRSQPATTIDWDDQSDLGLSWSDSESYSDDDFSTDERGMPIAGKRSREMTLGGLVFNSSQFTANTVLEQSLSTLLSNQGILKMTAEGFPDAEAKRTKSPKSSEPNPAVKDLVITAPVLSLADIQRVTSTPAFEALKATIEASAHSAYEYSTEMNVEDIMAMRNLTKAHGARTFPKTKSLSAPDLTAPSMFAGSKQMDELEEEDENSESDSDEEAESASPKPHRHVAADFSKTSPDDYLQSIVKDTFGICPEKVTSCDLQDYFLSITPDMISSYDMDVATAVRNEDLRVLSRIHRKGKTLQCCNRFGESIVHTVCRRGSIKILQFLMDTAQISLKVKCDYGRTPLHDACWTRDPNFELIAIVVKECPDFLWMTDKRGFTPLTYVQRDQWGMWCVFLEEHKLILKPKVIS